eukprot:TRINITY_DN74591_c0_g1_i1.p1 TRINITY_DN74591_c0_g1~~TRINITY_DN74591_c0_g1_i1.p1  ORF type:complete len:197 (-),score=35.85 TRINITY_DN74591_c0_g1_i1:254-844(-)
MAANSVLKAYLAGNEGSSAWLRFTPASIDRTRCMARIWGDGNGLQCKNAPSEHNDVCNSHYGNMVHGRVDGSIPVDKLVEFMQAASSNGLEAPYETKWRKRRRLASRDELQEKSTSELIDFAEDTFKHSDGCRDWIDSLRGQCHGEDGQLNRQQLLEQLIQRQESELWQAVLKVRETDVAKALQGWNNALARYDRA